MLVGSSILFDSFNTIQKVKGHKDAGNIEVDQIAKEGTVNGKWLDIKDLFTQEQSFIENDRLLLFDYKEFMQRDQTKRRNEIASHKSNRGPQTFLHLSPRLKIQEWDFLEICRFV